MDVRLSPDQEEFIRRAVEKGRYGKAEDVVREALAMLQERERKRAEILEAVDFAEISISRAAGGGLPQPATSRGWRQNEAWRSTQACGRRAKSVAWSGAGLSQSPKVFKKPDCILRVRACYRALSLDAGHGCERRAASRLIHFQSPSDGFVRIHLA